MNDQSMTEEAKELPSQVKGLSNVEGLWGGQSSFHVQTTFSVLGFSHKVDLFYCVVKQLELSSEYFGDIAQIGWA